MPPKFELPSNYLDENEAASLLKVDIDFLRRNRFRGNGPKPFRVPSRGVFYRREDLESWLNENASKADEVGQ